MTVRVEELLKDYKGNELRGDNKYKGKRIRVFGKVGDIKRDITGSIFVTIGTGAELEIPEAQAFFGEEYVSQASSLNKGNNVLVNCDGVDIRHGVMPRRPVSKWTRSPLTARRSVQTGSRLEV